MTDEAAYGALGVALDQAEESGLGRLKTPAPPPPTATAELARALGAGEPEAEP